jgi:hypothetical protein
MKSVLDYFPDWPLLGMGNELVKAWSGCLLAFHEKKEFSMHEVLTIGTGFFADFHGLPFVVTAAHVARQYNRGFGVGVTNQRVGALLLDGKPMWVEDRQDIAMVPAEWVAQKGKISAFPTLIRKDQIPTSSFMIFGFPSTKNNIHIKRNSDRTVFNILLNGFACDKNTGDLLFEYDPKNNFFEPGSSLSGAPSLQGLSGSPIAQVLISEKGQISLRAVGVFKEYKKREGKRLVGGSFAFLSDDMAE